MQNVDKNQKKFFPYYFFEVAVVALLTVEAVLLLAVVFPPSIGREIDFLAQYSPRPEWYFLFLYQFTKYFPGKWTFIGAVLLPGLDSTKEEFFQWENVFLARGMATLSLDGPGQGEAGLSTRIEPAYEKAVAAALDQIDRVVAGLDDIHEVNDAGIRLLMSAHRWGGAAFHDAGWNARHLDGVDHNFLYCLEYQTGRSFIHGQAVGLGTYLGAVLQDNQPEVVLGWLHRAGVDIRPEAMGIDWDAAGKAMQRLAWYVRHADYPYTIADARPVTAALVDGIRGYASW